MRLPFRHLLRCKACNCLALGVAAAAAGRPVRAQVADSARVPALVGLALSGGSAKGLAHVGVLRVLEDAGLPVHRVAGTSMGAILGGLYAIGYSPMQLDSIVRATDWPLAFRDTRERRFVGYEERAFTGRTFLTLPIVGGDVSLPGGAVAGQRIGELLARLTWPARATRDFRALPRPFVAVATDLASGAIVVLDTGSLARALRASSSLPTIFEPVRLDGRTVIDGYVVRNLPAPEVRALGADLVVCSDVTDLPDPADTMRTLLDLFARTVVLQGAVLADEQQRTCDLLIRPDLSGLGPFTFDKAGEWIRRGEAAARAQLPALRELAARAAPASPVPAVPAIPDAAPIARIAIPGIPPGSERFVERRVRLRPGMLATSDSLAAAVDRAYASGVFRRVGYDATMPGDSLDVRVIAEPQSEDRVGLGVRYDS
jgi:NTE family protein